MYTTNDLYVAEEGDYVTDSRNDYSTLKPGEAFLVHSCREWVIGGREQIELLIEDLKKLL